MGGHIAKKLGDGLMALFGYPVAQEKDAERERDFPLTGNNAQNRPCKGDGSDAAELRGTILPQGIVSGVILCTLKRRNRDRGNIEARVECRFPAGPLLGDVSFKMKPDGTIYVADRDQNYRAVLYRCPSENAATKSGHE